MIANTVAGLIAILVFPTALHGDYITITALIFIVFIGVFLLKLRLISGVLAAFIYLSAYQFQLVFFSNLDVKEIFTLSCFVWTILPFVIISSYVSERTNRLLFVKDKINKEQKIQVDKANFELGEKNREILESIRYAKRIQSAIFPPEKMVNEYLENSFIFYRPKDIVSGDFYILEPRETKVIFAAADCTGHGVPGALVSVICNHALIRSIEEFGLTEPGLILDKTREIVIHEFKRSEDDVKDGMDIALCTLDGNKLHFAGAQNPLWLIRRDSQEVEEVKADKQPIGKFAESTPYTTHTFELSKGDTFYIFSDGFSDQFGGEAGKKFKAVNFKKLLISIQNESMPSQGNLLRKAFEQWKANLEQVDDVCVIGVRMS